ncbi:MAG: histidine--tRNA ligase [Candidatus Paceibacterota bacterium]|jgi:histidyl-tRNA synthetase
MKKLSTEAYKGTRDFYPEDMRLQNYIFATMKSVVEKYGYEEYTASILEESDLYRAKTGEEIVNEQTYSFIDRGGRDVTLRPEMTPTVARMVANKRKTLFFPLRWYSIPNCFRYERPQRGRLREFWQLNVDLLGTDSLFADAEIIKIAYDIMDAFGADPKTFVIKVNNRKLMNEFFKEILKLDEEKSYRLSKLIDKKSKVSEKEFTEESESLVGNQRELLDAFLKATTLDELPEIISDSKNLKELRDVMNTLNSQGVKNCIFDPTLMRGFDYYTGIVFEVFDLNPLNNRSLFGGGRYDNLVDLFGVEPVPAVGFGMGDLTMQTYLETYNLTPKLETKIDVIICMLDKQIITQAVELATVLRKNGVTVVIDYTDKKMGQKIKNADKKQIPFVVIYGPEEVARNEVTIKMMKTGKQKTIPQNQITNYFKGYN